MNFHHFSDSNLVVVAAISRITVTSRITCSCIPRQSQMYTLTPPSPQACSSSTSRGPRSTWPPPAFHPHSSRNTRPSARRAPQPCAALPPRAHRAHRARHAHRALLAHHVHHALRCHAYSQPVYPLPAQKDSWLSQRPALPAPSSEHTCVIRNQSGIERHNITSRNSPPLPHPSHLPPSSIK